MARENIPMQAYTDPFQGVPRVTERLLIPTGLTTLLGPVPSGHVFVVTDVDFSNQDTLATAIVMSVTQDNGAGHLFSFGTSRSIAVASGVRLPDCPVDAGGVHHYPAGTFHMLPDDLLRVFPTAAPTAAGFMMKVSYMDVLQ